MLFISILLPQPKFFLQILIFIENNNIPIQPLKSYIQQKLTSHSNNIDFNNFYNDIFSSTNYHIFPLFYTNIDRTSPNIIPVEIVDCILGGELK